MTSLIKVFVVPCGLSRTTNKAYAGDSEVSRWVNKDKRFTTVPSARQADILVFTGGLDINPGVYNQPEHPRTLATAYRRDVYESNLFYLNHDKLKVGICRGAQLLNVLSGGTLIQHVNNFRHKRPHDLKIERTGQIMKTTSTHHQLMVPNPKMKTRSIIATAHCSTKPLQRGITDPCHKDIPSTMNRKGFFDKYTTNDFDPLVDEVEILYYNNSKSLCIQGHPERVSTHLGASFDCLDFSLFCSQLMQAYYRTINPVETPEETDKKTLMDAAKKVFLK